MSLDAFFAHVGPYLTGERSLADLAGALGPLPSPAADYAFYQHLLAHDRERDLGLLYPATRAWLARAGPPWPEVCAAFFRERPPRGHSVPHQGAGFADWLAARSAVDARIPPGAASVADLAWTRFLARTAPDGLGLGLDRRLFVRRYPIDAVAARRSLLAGELPPPPAPATWLVYRCLRRGTVHELGATRATVAVLLEAAGAPIPEPLRLAEGEAREERARLRRHGAIPSPAEESSG